MAKMRYKKRFATKGLQTRNYRKSPRTHRYIDTDHRTATRIDPLWLLHFLVPAGARAPGRQGTRPAEPAQPTEILVCTLEITAVVSLRMVVILN